MDLELAMQLSIQYYNLYMAAKLEEKKANMLRTFRKQVMALGQAAQPPPPAGAPVPQATAEPLPSSPLVPNAQAPQQ